MPMTKKSKTSAAARMMLLVAVVAVAVAWTDAWLLTGHFTSSFPTSRRFHNTLVRSCSQSHPTEETIDILHGPWNATQFGVTGHWGRRPLLWKQAFVSSATALPSWEEILDLACANPDDDVTCRLIRHQSGALDSFNLEFGPFASLDTKELNDILQSNDEMQASTLVVNDVDRWIPDVSDWMDNEFEWLPRWRRDDAQVSLAAKGGGIGPHVDNYDVFLIQTSGHREWKVALEPISVETELDHLVETSQVRILDERTGVSTVTLQLAPGDCLYLPPRFQHCGTATSDDCVTLSVGCRAPSAADLVLKLAESVATSARESAVRRYSDQHLWMTSSSSSSSSPTNNNKSLTTRVKEDMKTLVVDLVQDFLSDDSFWDDLVGKLTTEPNRPVFDYPTPLKDLDPAWRQDLGPWGNAEAALDSILAGDGILRRVEGVAFAWSSSSSSSSLNASSTKTLYAQGRAFQVPNEEELEGDQEGSFLVSTDLLLDRITNGPPISKDWLEERNPGGTLAPGQRALLRRLLEEGLLYGEDAA